MSDILIFKGNTSPSITDTIEIDGDPVDLTGASVEFRMRGDTDPDAADTVAADATVVTAADGTVRYDWADGDTDTAGAYHAWWQVTFSSGAIQDTPDFTVEIVDHATIESTTYASIDQLFRILRVRQPSEQQVEAASLDLATASLEINSEIDLASTTPALSGWKLNLATNVCLDRAADLWRHRESLPGVAGVLDDAPVATPGYTRYSWERYAVRLAPLKDQWGLA